MKYLIVAALLLFSTFSANANMPYWGPKGGHVAGRNTDGQLRVLHEKITVDMRGIPNGSSHVIADYLIQSRNEAGYMTFLFVASAEHPVSPKVTLDGIAQNITPFDTSLKLLSGGNYGENMTRDSLTEIIGLDLERSPFHFQTIFDRLYSFTLFIKPGQHRLIVSYDLIPTAFEEGDLRYYAFSYYLGNKYTRPLYDSVELKVLYPKGITWQSNVPCTARNNELFCTDLKDFKASHISITLYKNIQPVINRGRKWLQAAHILLWSITGLLTLFWLHRRLEKGKKVGYKYAWVVPIALILGIAYYFFLDEFFEYFRKQYNPWLKGSFGKGYYFLSVPVVAIITGSCWLLLVFIYQWWFGKLLEKRNQKRM